MSAQGPARARDAPDFDVVVVGAGVVGAAMAGLLLGRGLCAAGRIAVLADRLETAPPATDDWDLRVFALSRASERVLKACGAWSLLPEERVFAFERMRVWDAEGEPGGTRSIGFDCAEIGEPNLGYIVEGRSLQWQCNQAARAAGAAFIAAGLAGVEPAAGANRLRLSDGRELTCRLLIAADGPNSKTRELLGIETAGHSYEQDALVAHVRTDRPHAGTAWQRFLSTGPLAFLPLPDGRSSIVWSVDLAQARRLRALDRDEFAAALSDALGGALGRCELTTPLAAFPLKLQYAVHYVRPGAVLVGDAAHVVHPLAGQGLNLGLLDCAVLSEVLGDAPAARGFAEMPLLRRYERRRRAENMAAAAALDGLERLFSSSDALSVGVRGMALRVADRWSYIKGGLARRALGLSGDVPDFLRDGRASPRR